METNSKSCLTYFEMQDIVELVSSSFGDDEQSLRIFQTFLKNKTGDTESPFDTMDRKTDPPLAALNGRFRVVKWLYSHMDRDKDGERLFESMCFSSAEGGHLEILKWLRENGCPWSQCTCTSAVYRGHLDCLKWARDNGCEWDSKFTLIIAAKKGHLDCLKWGRNNGCSWYVKTCAFAALNGHLDCLKWLRENGCPWDKDTCAAAALNGHLDCLKWLRENGCPWDKDTCTAAALNGHLDCLKWARENGCSDN